VLPEPRLAVTLAHAGGDARQILLASREEALLQGMH
jgi:hypothetical protein